MKSMLRQAATTILALVLSGCTGAQILYSAVPIPDEVREDQVYWSPWNITSEGCPDIPGTYLISGQDHLNRMHAGLVKYNPKTQQPNRMADVEITIARIPGGISVHQESQDDIGINTIYFSDTFGCYGGYYVKRDTPYVSTMGEGGRCPQVYYDESWFKVNEQGDLEVSRQRRVRCWLDRMSEHSEDDWPQASRVHRRIR